MREIYLRERGGEIYLRERDVESELRRRERDVERRRGGRERRRGDGVERESAQAMAISWRLMRGKIADGKERYDLSRFRF